MNPGKYLLPAKGNTVAVEQVEFLDRTATVYIIEVAGHHTYFVSDEEVLVHNACRPPNLSPPGAGRRGAFRQAKRDAGIPMSQEPSAVMPSRDRAGNIVPGRTYEFTGPHGERTVIREHASGHSYGPGDAQNRGPHFNWEGNHYDY